MALADKVLKTVGKYGFTYRGYVMSTLIFPPAGMYIGWKMPGASLITRIGLTVLPLVVIQILPAIVILVFKN